jgi:hypothetical protein
MSALIKRWNRFWFEPATADNLGLARIFLFGSIAIFYVATPYLFPSWGWHTRFADWGTVNHVFWIPIWLFRTLHLPQLSYQSIHILEMIWRLSLILSAIGLFTRLSTWTAFVVSPYLFGLPNNFGETQHLDMLLVWSFFSMAMSRCGDSWSVDRLFRIARSGGRLASEPARVSGDYTWPIRLIWVTICCIFFCAAMSKLRHSGLAWVYGDQMSFFLIRAQYHATVAEPITNWGFIIGSHPWASRLIAFMSLSLEFFYPLALVSKRLRWMIVPSGVLMQVGIAVMMGPNFYQMIICQVLWLPLDRLVAPLGRFGRPSARVQQSQPA